LSNHLHYYLYALIINIQYNVFPQFMPCRNYQIKRSHLNYLELLTSK